MTSLPRILGAAAGAAFLAFIPGVPRAAPAVHIQDIRFWNSAGDTRVAIDLSGEAPYEVNFLSRDPAKGLPPRIFVDIRGAAIREEIIRRPLEVRNGLLRVVRAGRHRPGVVRVVIDLDRESRFRAFDISNPFRIILDVSGEGGGEGSPAAGEPARDRIRVMLDPGHGGADPGAVGPTGLREKDVVLSIGKLVRERLARSGEFEVLMTRDRDVFIPLEDRTMMANEAGAKIFVSLHINASRNRNAEGISTYVLSRATDREALELAARENGVSPRKLSTVKFIIDDLSTNPRKNESLKLAKTVNDTIVRNLRSRHGRTHDLGLRQAPFYVLVGARMTAVLVESSFISNRAEEARLRKAAYLETVADSVASAVRFYAEKGVRAARAGP